MRAGFVLLIVVAAISLIAASVVRDRRPAMSDLDWETAELNDSSAGAVTVTWFGISTLLFDDGETQILIDGTFSRINWLNALLMQKISSDIANINNVMARYRIDRLAAIVPTHSHIDHAMDTGLVANRSSAVILGSESTANIARGADVPVDQYQILADRESRQFGQFKITLIASRHAPFGLGERALLAGDIADPLQQPARITKWREGVVYSVVVAHPRGTTLVQGSGGFVRNNLQNIDADVVMLGIGGLQRLGEDYFREYWQETVDITGAMRVFPIHFDDFTEPFGQTRLLPYVLDDATITANWADEVIATGENPVEIQLLPFGESVAIY